MTSVHSQQSQANALLNFINASGLPASASRTSASAPETTLLAAQSQSLAQHQNAIEGHLHALPVHFVTDQASNPAPIVPKVSDAPILIPKDNSINDDQLAVLVSTREREVADLQATLSQHLATFNAKFIWHCIMNHEPDCEQAFVDKIKSIHKTFYLPPAIAFYSLWLQFRFWDRMPKIYYAIEAILPATNSSLSKPARVAVIMYMLAASFANKHLDDFSYRNSSWYEAARIPAKDFLDVELLALKELSWSLEIGAKEWTRWLHHLRTANITLERTRPTTETFHFVLARLLQDAIIASGDKDEALLYRRGRTRNRMDIGSWNNTSPTLVSSEGASPPNTNTSRVNENIADGPYGLYALQRKLEAMHQKNIRDDLNNMSRQKHIPWDTSLDPVVHVQPRARSGSGASRSRSSSGSDAALMFGEPVVEQPPIGFATVGFVFGADHHRNGGWATGYYPVVPCGVVTGGDMLAGRPGPHFFVDTKSHPGYAQVGYGGAPTFQHPGPLKTCNSFNGVGMPVGIVGDHWQQCL